MNPIVFTPGLLAGGHRSLAQAEQARKDVRAKERPTDQAANAAK